MRLPTAALPDVLQPEPRTSEFDGYKELAAAALEGMVDDWIDPSKNSSWYSSKEFIPDRLDILDFVYSERFVLFALCLDWVTNIEVARKAVKRRLLALLKVADRNELIYQYYDAGRSPAQLAERFQMKTGAIYSVIKRRNSNGE